MRPMIDMVGRRVGRLVVLSLAGRDPTTWLCRCDCGRETSACALAREYGVSKRTVLNIVHGRAWAHLLAEGRRP